MDNFPGLIKISMTTEKIEVARLQELNSNSFEYNLNGFELGLGLVWPKMFGFLVELGKRTKELSTKFESRKSKEGKVKDLTCKWVADNSKLMEYFIIAP